MTTITRFAPSPSGHLHLGHVKSALFSAEQAWERGGRFLVRIEDIDFERCRPEYEESTFEDLRWIGLQWEEPVMRQSEHMDRYAKELEKLDDMGVTYPCFCSRREIRRTLRGMDHVKTGPDGPLYPGTCRGMDKDKAAALIAEGKPFNVRLDVVKAMDIAGSGMVWDDIYKGEQKATPEIMGDVILARKDTPTSYNLSVVVDDDVQDITLVTRGMDLFHASHLHRLLQELLSLKVPQYAHHDLIMDIDGEKLSKRKGEHKMIIRTLRNEGMSAEEIRTLAGYQNWKYIK